MNLATRPAIGSARAALIFLMTLGAAVLTHAQNMDPVAEREIAHLLDYLNTSSCRFNRNGSWYSAAEATDHLHKKYDYLVSKHKLSSAEDVIALAASQSSMSGKTYQVQCGDNPPQNTSPWFALELTRFRQSIN